MAVQVIAVTMAENVQAEIVNAEGVCRPHIGMVGVGNISGVHNRHCPFAHHPFPLIIDMDNTDLSPPTNLLLRLYV